MKKLLTTTQRIGATFVLALAASVALNSMHAKDAVAFAKSPVELGTFKKAAPATDDPNAYKLVGELHNHVDKHSLKSMNIHKSFADPNFATDPRNNRNHAQREDDENSQFIDWLKRVLQTALLPIK